MSRPGGYAHLPGGGPASATCRECVHSQTVRRGDKGECELARKFKGWSAGTISLYAQSCKYFEPVPPPPKAEPQVNWKW